MPSDHFVASATAASLHVKGLVPALARIPLFAATAASIHGSLQRVPLAIVFPPTGSVMFVVLLFVEFVEMRRLGVEPEVLF
jgi:hypothetical protein